MEGWKDEGGREEGKKKGKTGGKNRHNYVKLNTVHNQRENFKLCKE